MFNKLAAHGPLLVVVDQPATIGALRVAVAPSVRSRGGLPARVAMRRIADLVLGTVVTAYLGAAKDRRTARAQTARAAFLLDASLVDLAGRYESEQEAGRAQLVNNVVDKAAELNAAAVAARVPRGCLEEIDHLTRAIIQRIRANAANTGASTDPIDPKPPRTASSNPNQTTIFPTGSHMARLR